MNDSSPVGLFGYAGQPDTYTLADGRDVQAGELVDRAFADYREMNAGQKWGETQARDAFNAMTDGARRVFIEGCLAAWNEELEAGAAAVDLNNATTKGAQAKAEVLLGDALIDDALAEVKALRRPWQEMSADAQSDVLERITAQVKDAVSDTLRLLSTRGAHHIVCELESVTVKKGAKATLDIPKGELDQDVLEAVGQQVILVVGSMDALGEIHQPEPDPDQRTLGLQTMVGDTPDTGLATSSDPED